MKELSNKIETVGDIFKELNHPGAVPQSAEEKLTWDWPVAFCVGVNCGQEIATAFAPDKRHKNRIVYYGQHYWGEHLISEYPCVAINPDSRKGTHR